jgi:hypothetical protein
MFKLEAMKVFGLYGVSDNPGSNGLFQLAEFKDDAFNKPIGGSEIDYMLTDLTNHLYDCEDDCRWYEITDNVCNDGVVCIKIDHLEYLVAPSINDFVDTCEETYRLFIVANRTRDEFQWIVAIPLGNV